MYRAVREPEQSPARPDGDGGTDKTGPRDLLLVRLQKAGRGKGWGEEGHGHARVVGSLGAAAHPDDL